MPLFVNLDVCNTMMLQNNQELQGVPTYTNSTKGDFH